MIEYLTDEICKKTQEYIGKIDALGGALAAIENGFMQAEIQEAAYRYQKEVERKEQAVVGVNTFQTNERLELERVAVDPAIAANQCTRLTGLRARRDAARASELMTRLEAAGHNRERLMPLFIDCVENSITLGEICSVLRQVWGEYQPTAWI